MGASLRARQRSRHSPKCGAATGRHLGCSATGRKPGSHTTSEMEQGCPSRSPSSPLPNGSGTSVAILFSSPNYLATHFLCCFGLLPLPYLLLLEPRSCNPQSPSFSFYFLVHSRKKVLIEIAKGYDTKPSRLHFTVGKILLADQFHTVCWRLHLLDKTKCRLAKIPSQERGEETREIRCWPTYSRSSKKPTTAL